MSIKSGIYANACWHLMHCTFSKNTNCWQWLQWKILIAARLVRVWHDVYRNGHLMCASSKEDASNGRHVGIIATPAQRNIVGGGHSAIRWIEIDPAPIRKIDRDPGVRRIGPDQTRLARRRLGDQVTADIAGRETK